MIIVGNKEIVENSFHAVFLFLFILGYGSSMQLLVCVWVLCANVDLVVLEDNALRWVFVEHNVKGDLLRLTSFEEVVILHLLPRQTLNWVVLHRLVEEIKTLEGDLDV